ncbi:MAG: lysylphosphatidylglycerol synthase domain-containing protein, partial [Candidatus Micrarchaeota archaeon]
GLGMLAGMIVLILLLLFSERFARLLSFINRLPYGAKVHKLITDMQENSHAIKALVPFLISILAVTWSFKALEWWFVGMSLGFRIDVPFPEVVFYAFLQPVVTLLQFIPTPTLAGIGVAEAGAALVLMQFGITLPEAVAFTLLTRFVMIITDALGIAEGVKALRIG